MFDHAYSAMRPSQIAPSPEHGEALLYRGRGATPKHILFSALMAEFVYIVPDLRC